MTVLSNKMAFAWLVLLVNARSAAGQHTLRKNHRGPIDLDIASKELERYLGVGNSMSLLVAAAVAPVPKTRKEAKSPKSNSNDGKNTKKEGTRKVRVESGKSGKEGNKLAKSTSKEAGKSSKRHRVLGVGFLAEAATAPPSKDGKSKDGEKKEKKLKARDTTKLVKSEGKDAYQNRKIPNPPEGKAKSLGKATSKSDSSVVADEPSKSGSSKTGAASKSSISESAVASADESSKAGSKSGVGKEAPTTSMPSKSGVVSSPTYSGDTASKVAGPGGSKGGRRGARRLGVGLIEEAPTKSRKSAEKGASRKWKSHRRMTGDGCSYRMSGKDGSKSGSKDGSKSGSSKSGSKYGGSTKEGSRRLEIGVFDCHFSGSYTCCSLWGDTGDDPLCCKANLVSDIATTTKKEEPSKDKEEKNDNGPVVGPQPKPALQKVDFVRDDPSPSNDFD